MSKHTQGPWIVKGGDLVCIGNSELRRIADCRQEAYMRADVEAENAANAAFIVRVCNSHDELLDALTKLVNIATHPKATKPDIRMIALEARAAIAKVERGSK